MVKQALDDKQIDRLAKLSARNTPNGVDLVIISASREEGDRCAGVHARPGPGTRDPRQCSRASDRHC